MEERKGPLSKKNAYESMQMEFNKKVQRVV